MTIDARKGSGSRFGARLGKNEPLLATAHLSDFQKTGAQFNRNCVLVDFKDSHPRVRTHRGRPADRGTPVGGGAGYPRRISQIASVLSDQLSRTSDPAVSLVINALQIRGSEPLSPSSNPNDRVVPKSMISERAPRRAQGDGARISRTRLRYQVSAHGVPVL
jgi:hypothetical protein